MPLAQIPLKATGHAYRRVAPAALLTLPSAGRDTGTDV